MKKWAEKKGGLSGGGQFSSNLSASEICPDKRRTAV